MDPLGVSYVVIVRSLFPIFYFSASLVRKSSTFVGVFEVKIVGMYPFCLSSWHIVAKPLLKVLFLKLHGLLVILSFGISSWG